MNIFQLIQVVCLDITLACFPVIIYYLRKAARYNRITDKLRHGEELTARERRILEAIK